MNLTSIVSNWKEVLQKAFVHDPETPVMFNSTWFFYTFIVFLGIYIIIAHRKQARILYVTCFSLFFYYKSSGWHFTLLLFSTFVDYLFGLMIFMYQHEGIKRRNVKVLGRWRQLIDLSLWFGYDPEMREMGRIGWLPDRLISFFEGVVTILDNLVNWLYLPKEKKRKQKFFLVLSLMTNLGMLAGFKYTSFILENVNTLFSQDWSVGDILLPVGISFFTFQTMSYTIDIYRQKLQPVSSMLDFGFYVSFFPQLVAGPIVRASEFLPQIRSDIKISQDDIGRGLMLITVGLFKKAVISDFISTTFVDQIFEVPTIHTGFENLMAVYAYALQIYCDFSGYSDMAIGIGLLMGYRLPLNFNAPYQSASIQEFWRRWHISLSFWLRDYLYISLGGNRKGDFRTYVNLMITMLLGGLWHGSSWLFIIWGGLHGAALAFDRMFKGTFTIIRRRVRDFLESIGTKRDEEDGQVVVNSRLSMIVGVVSHMWGVLFTFHFVCLCWIFFRAESLTLAFEMIEQILFNFHPEIIPQILTNPANHWAFFLMGLGYMIHFIPNDIDGVFERGFVRSPLVLKSVAMAGIIWLVLMVQVEIGGEQPFIYYQF
ncbi:MAG: MBOAT family O-acyltransferase [Bacteroidota bacterium]